MAKTIVLYAGLHKPYYPQSTLVELMATFDHAVYIDESGNGASRHHMDRLWVTVGLAFPFANMNAVNTGVRSILGAHFHPRVKELKGTAMPHALRPTASVDDVARDLNVLLTAINSKIWVTITQANTNPLPNFPVPNPAPKEITRQLLFERINGYLNQWYSPPGDWLLLWDISDQQELHDFSKSVANFHNLFSGSPPSPKMAPAVLGALSHDWTGLQIADVVANFALHKEGMTRSLPGAWGVKAQAFDQYLYPCLMKAANGNVVGWKVW